MPATPWASVIAGAIAGHRVANRAHCQGLQASATICAQLQSPPHASPPRPVHGAPRPVAGGRSTHSSRVHPAQRSIPGRPSPPPITYRPQAALRGRQPGRTSSASLPLVPQTQRRRHTCAHGRHGEADIVTAAACWRGHGGCRPAAALRSPVPERDRQAPIRSHTSLRRKTPRCGAGAPRTQPSNSLRPIQPPTPPPPSPFTCPRRDGRQARRQGPALTRPGCPPR